MPNDAPSAADSRSFSEANSLLASKPARRSHPLLKRIATVVLLLLALPVFLLGLLVAVPVGLLVGAYGLIRQALNAARQRQAPQRHTRD